MFLFRKYKMPGTPISLKQQYKIFRIFASPQPFGLNRPIPRPDEGPDGPVF